MKVTTKVQFNVIFLIVTLVTSASQAFITDGRWTSACVSGLQKEQIINNLDSVYSENFYKDKDCTDLSFKFTTTSQLEYPLVNPEAWVNFKYSEISLTLFKQNIVNDFNSRSVCDYQAWKLNEAYPITGKSCALFDINRPAKIPQKGTVKYALYKTENDLLYYGQMTKEFDASTPEKRPVELSPFYFKHLEIR